MAESRSLAAAQGTSTWVRQEIDLVAPAGTRTVRYGVMLVGGGSAEVRVRIHTMSIPAPGTPPAAAAAEELESALAFVRAHSRHATRGDVRARARGSLGLGRCTDAG